MPHRIHHIRINFYFTFQPNKHMKNPYFTSIILLLGKQTHPKSRDMSHSIHQICHGMSDSIHWTSILTRISHWVCTFYVLPYPRETNFQGSEDGAFMNAKKGVTFFLVFFFGESQLPHPITSHAHKRKVPGSIPNYVNRNINI